MKKRMLPLLLALALCAAGCTSMLDRSYVSVETHEQFSDAGKDSSALRAETYQGLVSAILYLVSQGTEDGVVRLYNYTRDVETDLSSACLEVAKEDPLGAYAVDYIKYDISRIIFYYEAKVQITYRRTPEQIKSVVSVTGSSAIRDELKDALAQFSPEVILRISYFVEDEEYIRKLVREAYYDAPQAAFGVPELSVALYPESGLQRIVELTLTYPDGKESLRKKQEALNAAAERYAAGLEAGGGDLPAAIHALLLGRSVLLSEGSKGGNTAYAALVEGQAGEEGLALAYLLLCRLTGVEAMAVTGTQGDRTCYWNLVKSEGGWRHVSAAWKADQALTDEEMKSAGYVWDQTAYPAAVQTEGTQTAKNGT